MTERSMILIVGGSGQIGHELVRELSAFGTVTAPKRHELDLTSLDSTREVIRRMRPTVVVNAAAYTMVDRAESEPELCARINAESPALLAAECHRIGAALFHFSTDYVFDGRKRTPYVETDESMPLGVYGRTKRDGEDAVAAVGGAFIILRTAWVYGSRGRNFPATVLQLAREREELAVVNDQVGAPTSAPAVAAGVAQVLRVLGRERNLRDAVERASGVYHMTASGSTTWYDFARRILADDPRAIEHVCRVVRPINSDEYPRPARRPAYSVLDNTKLAMRFGVTLPSWTDQWRAMVEQLRLSGRSAFAPRAESRPSL
jgi:dTDP-4-dehydrorhamnose reductase